MYARLWDANRATLAAFGLIVAGCGRVGFEPRSDVGEAEPLTLTASTGAINVNGRSVITAAGGTPSYSYAIVSGDGAIDAATGEFVAPNYGGAVVVRVTDAGDRTADVTLTVGGSTLFVLGGWGGYTTDKVYRTTDGATWEMETLPTGRGETASVVLEDQLYLVGGWFSGSNISSVLVRTPADVAAWSTTGMLPAERGWGGVVVFRGRMFYAGGRSIANWANAEVYVSTTGSDWTEVGVLPESSTWGGLAVFHDRLWYLGGDHDPQISDAIYSSDDGATWTVHAETLPAPRAGGAIVAFHDRLWYLGGRDQAGAPHDQIWTSPDGLVWSDAGGLLPAALMNPAATVHDGKIWIIGGNDGNFRSSVFSSSDGQTWAQTTDLPETLDRFAAASFTP
jgi:hypothetical protein